MDELDEKILSLLRNNARMTVKEIARRISLTSPAVSERIRRLESGGVIERYTVQLTPAAQRGRIEALISISILPKDRGEFHQLLLARPEVEMCHQVTGTYSHIVKVSCQDIAGLEHVVSIFQKLGQTNTQIILSTIRGQGPVL